MKSATKFALILTLAAACLSTGAAFGASFRSPKGQFSYGMVGFEWKPGSACSKPYAIGGAGQAYLDQAKRYIKCVDEAASSDADWAVGKIRDDRDEAVDDMVQEARRVSRQ
jgi:hypothetical protein